MIGTERPGLGPASGDPTPNDEEYPNAAGLLWSTTQRHPSRTAIADGDVTVTYQELADWAGSFAGALVAAGADAGDRVTILHRRGVDAAAAFFGVLAAGGTAVLIPDVYPVQQVDHLLGHSGARFMFADPRLLARLSRPPQGPVTQLQPVAEREPVIPRAARAADELAQLVYTSGSTGRPKGVMVSHANLLAGVEAVSSYVEIHDDDRIASLLPFSFDYGLNQLLVAVASGAALVIERSPVPARIDETLRAQRVTVAAAVPYLWHQLLQVERFETEPLPAMRAATNSGGRLPEPTVHRLLAANPDTRWFSMYGLTEAFRSTYLDPDLLAHKPISVGKAIPGAEVLVVDADGKRCGPHETGEVVHRGPSVTLGYWRDPEATTKVFARLGDRDEPVVRTGDYGWVDDDGDLFLLGRLDLQIKRFGQRMCPDEIVDALSASGLVVDVCVIPHRAGPRADWEFLAHVVLKAPATTTQLEAYIAAEISRHLRPTALEAHPDALPLTTNAKHDLPLLQPVAG